MSALGNHILVEFTGCQPEVLNDMTNIEKYMVEAANKAGATVLNSTFHHFSPYGVSGVVVIQESHLAIHSWPEYGYAAVDLFTCGGHVDPWKSFDYLKECFGAQNYSALEMKRGALNLLTKLDVDLEKLRTEVSEKVEPQKVNKNMWFTDKDRDLAISLRYTGEVLYEAESEFQKIKILESYMFGKMLIIDNMIMTTEKDEYHYHEMIAHPAIFTHGNVKNVLIIGGGDGGAAREVLRHSGVEKVTVVEIDEKVIEGCKQQLPTLASSLDDAKVEVKIEDGANFAASAADDTYDLVIVDGYDPVGPAKSLFTEEFFKNVHRVLKADGVAVFQGESPRFNEQCFLDINRNIRDNFGENNAFVSLFYALTYPTGMWSFQLGFKTDVNPKTLEKKEEIQEFVKAQGLKYFNADMHKASFCHPNFLKKMLAQNVKKE